MEKLDQWAIYLFIAGTYTPFLINVVASPWREILMISIWTMALVGILYTAFRHKFPKWAQSRIIYTSVFLMMGWTLLLRLGEIIEKLPPLQQNCFLQVPVPTHWVPWSTSQNAPTSSVAFLASTSSGMSLVMIGFLCHFAMITSFYL
jgi:predicted membrane channel-forming protein YqfA (hemolysin III family)